jgi:hypothetical protein
LIRITELRGMGWINRPIIQYMKFEKASYKSCGIRDIYARDKYGHTGILCFLIIKALYKTGYYK